MGLLRAAFILVTLTVLFTVIQSQEHIRTKRRMYAMCPPKFQRIGSECYAISDQPGSWLEAHFQCKDKNSKLAEPNNRSDRKLRAFFQRMDHDIDQIWIGATYDWLIHTWQWSISGKNLTYDAFSRLDPESSQTLEYHCAVFNPSLKYRWSARPCVERHRYICQHKMPKVSERNRFKVYSRWNETFPNQLANEVEMEVIDTKSRDGKRTSRRLKPIDSGENYPMPPKRSNDQAKPRRRAHLPPRETNNNNNDINVKFIPNYLTNEINEGVSYRKPTHTQATMYPLMMDFIPAADMAIDGSNVQAAQAYMDTTTTTKQPRNPTNAPSSDNETTVNQPKPRRKPQGNRRRERTKFDDLIAEKRKLEINQKRRAEHRRRKQEKQKKEEEERKKQEQERKIQDDDRKRKEEERKQQEEDRQKQEQAAIRKLKLEQAEEERLIKEQEEAALRERQKLEAQQKLSKEEQERREEEEKILKIKQEEDEDRIRKQRLHEQNRMQMEYEETLKEQQTERERRLEEEKRKADENRRRDEQAQLARQEELKRQQEEDEKRLELQRIEIERKRQEKELARLEEENMKRLAAQKAREEEIRRREEALAAELAEEKRLQEELRIQEEKDRLIRDQEMQREIDEKKRKEEAEREEAKRKEELRKEKYKEKLAKESKRLEEKRQAEQLEVEKKREKMRKYSERISRLSPELQAKFLLMRKERKRNKQISNNEASIPERK